MSRYSSASFLRYASRVCNIHKHLRNGKAIQPRGNKSTISEKVHYGRRNATPQNTKVK